MPSFTHSCEAPLVCHNVCVQPYICGMHAAGLYQAGPRNKYFDLKAVTGWLLNSAFHAVLVFVLVMGCLTPLYPDRHGGATPGQWQTGATLFTAVVITVHLEIATIIEHWTIFHVAGIVFSVGKTRLVCHAVHCKLC